MVHTTFAKTCMTKGTQPFSEEGLMLSESYLKRLQDSSGQQYEAVVRLDAKNTARRLFFSVTINGAKYWADAKTGSLYNQSGRCMSSFALRLVDQPWAVSETQTSQLTQTLVA